MSKDWFYTEYEGGLWRPLDVGEMLVEEVIDSLQKNRFEDRASRHVFYSAVNGWKVAAVASPDRRIWDAYGGDFREGDTWGYWKGLCCSNLKFVEEDEIDGAA